jgi:hypothetical protein
VHSPPNIFNFIAWLRFKPVKQATVEFILEPFDEKSSSFGFTLSVRVNYFFGAAGATER